MPDGEHRRRIISGKAEQEEIPLLRPQSLRELDVGQDWVKPLRVYIAASRQAGEALPHLLLVGPLGVGKTTVARVLANEMGSNLSSASGRTLEREGDLVGIITSLERGDILLIDEVGRMPYVIAEYLLSAMSDFVIDFVVDKGPDEKTISLDLKPFTLIGEEETTRKLEPRLLAAFHRTIEIKWTTEELERLLAFRNAKGKLNAEPEVLRIIAEAADGTMADAVKMLTEAAIYARAAGEEWVTVALATDALGQWPIHGERQSSSVLDAVLPGEGLERAVAGAVEQRGFQVQNIRHSKDGGVDIVAVSDDPITGGCYIIQCKDWSHNVGADTVRELLGTVVRENAVQGILVTTSSFTRQARTEAKGQRIRLIDGTELARLLRG